MTKHWDIDLRAEKTYRADHIGLGFKVRTLAIDDIGKAVELRNHQGNISKLCEAPLRFYYMYLQQHSLTKVSVFCKPKYKQRKKAFGKYGNTLGLGNIGFLQPPKALIEVTAVTCWCWTRIMTTQCFTCRPSAWQCPPLEVGCHCEHTSPRPEKTGSQNLENGTTTIILTFYITHKLILDLFCYLRSEFPHSLHDRLGENYFDLTGLRYPVHVELKFTSRDKHRLASGYPKTVFNRTRLEAWTCGHRWLKVNNVKAKMSTPIFLFSCLVSKVICFRWTLLLSFPTVCCMKMRKINQQRSIK